MDWRSTISPWWLAPETTTKSWWPWPETSTKTFNNFIATEDPGLFYLWSPLMIFSVVLACVVGLAIIIILAVLIYNYCTYGMCCCPGFGCNNAQSCDLCCCMTAQKQEPTKIIHKRRMSYSGDDTCSQCSRGSIRVRNVDRKVVRISDMPTVHPIRVRQPGPELSEICLVPQDLPQMVVQRPPSVIHQPSTIQPIAVNPPVANCPRPQSGFQGGELRVIIGNAEQVPSRSNNIVYSMNQTPSVSCQISRTQPEYRLTSVDHSMNGGGGGFGTTTRGFSSYDQDDHNSCFSDGQRSAVIDIGQRNSFYPSLSQYDN